MKYISHIRVLISRPGLLPAQHLLHAVRHERQGVLERPLVLLEAPQAVALGLDLRLRALNLPAHLVERPLLLRARIGTLARISCQILLRLSTFR